MKNIKNYKYLIFFIVISTIIYTLLNTEKNNKIQSYLKDETSQIYLEYKAIYNQQKKFSQIIFDSIINKEDIIEPLTQIYTNPKDIDKVRADLYEKLKDPYFKLKQYNLKQLHFHLKNSDSFLRMHRPNLHGDNLKKARSTVAYVNENKKYIEGFEEGKIFNGYRFVYPIFNKNYEHLGSVEISFSALAMITFLKDTYGIDSNLLIKKSVVDKKVFEFEKSNYVKSPNPKFYFEKSIVEKFSHDNKTLPKKIDEINKKIEEGKPFTVYIKEKLRTFIPLVNPVSKEIVATLVIYKDSLYIPNKYKNFYFLTFSLILLLGIILKYIDKLSKAKADLTDLNKNLDKKVKRGIRTNRQKDLKLLHQTKMISLAELLNNISHQWKQPLSIITTSASGLKLQKTTDSLDEKNFELLTNSILEQSKNLSETLESFNDLFESDEHQSTINLSEKISNIVRIVVNDENFKDIKITTICNDFDLQIHGSISQFSQVLVHILNNARDAIGKSNKIHKEIIIRIFEKENNAYIEIEDTGDGIKSEAINQIFEPYFTTKHKSVGTGVGLYMSYQILQNKFNGQIKARNVKNGARFTIIVPLSA